MAESSSTFNFEYLRRFVRLDRRTHAWHALVVASTLVVFGLCFGALESLFRSPAWSDARARVLFLGTSHTATLPAGKMPWPSAKIAFPALDVDVASAAVEEHRDLWPELELAVIEIDEFSLFSDTVASQVEDLSSLCGRMELSAWALPLRPDDPLLSYQAFLNLFYGRGVPALYHRHRLRLQNVVRVLPAAMGTAYAESTSSVKSASSTTTKSEQRAPLTEDTAKGRIQIARHRYFRHAEEANSKRNAEALASLVTSLRQEGVSVVFLTLPTHSSYSDERPSKWDDWIDAAIASVCDRCGHVPYLDLRDDSRFVDEDFKDPDHLNARGARRLVDVLAASIRDSGWLRGPSKR
ncbi:MAG: SGNH/GDSL hydrolase family protein [Planctomycetota bacterium]